MFKEVKYNRNGVLSSLYEEIKLLDGLDFCGWLDDIGVESDGCAADRYGGFLLIPTTDMVTIAI